MDKNKKIFIELVVVLVLVGFGIWGLSQNPAPAPVANKNGVSPAQDVAGNAGNVDASAPGASISYAQALVKYKNARLQLDKICQASPDKMTFKNGANLMVDNRAPVARTVKVGSVFPLKAYGFKIVNLSSATLPATWYVDCDKSQNVSTILIQK